LLGRRPGRSHASSAGVAGGRARKSAYRRAFEPFKKVFAGCGRLRGLCIETQLASQTVF
jgi:hypothetical protein